MLENELNMEDTELSPTQEVYIESLQVIANLDTHGIVISDAVAGYGQSVAHPIPCNLNAQFEEATAADIINTGLYAHPYAPLRVSTSMAEQQAAEADLVTAMGEELLEEINNYGAPQTSEVPDPDLIMAPTFEIAVNPTIRLNEIKSKKILSS